ncbi:MAG: hypothetical protein KA436_10800 [Oligoflexales bacterium]|nr:hypothetical protein [Oligoflexales bacterium]
MIIKNTIKIITLFFIGLSTNTQAMDQEILIQLSSIYKDISAVDLEPMNYWVDFEYESTSLNRTLQKSSYCLKNKNYMKFSRKKLLLSIQDDLSEAIDLGFKDVHAFPLHTDLFRVLKLLDQALRSHLIEICEDTSTPPYSDGHQARFVKVDGKLTFIFQKGYPD